MIITKLIILAFLLLFSAFFSGSETAYFSLSRFDIQYMNIEKKRGAKGVISLLEKPGRLLVGILSGNMIVNIAATTLMTGVFMELLGEGGVPVAIAIMTALILVFGEITPKTIAIETNEKWARFSSPILKFIIFILAPLRWFLEKTQNMITKSHSHQDLRLDEVDLDSALELAHSKGTILDKDLHLIKHFLLMYRDIASEIMIPRAELAILNNQVDIEDSIKCVSKSESKIGLIYSEDNSVIKVIDQRDIDKAIDFESLEKYAKIPGFIPANLSLADLFINFLEQENNYLLVIDEHGDAVGLITRDLMLYHVFCKSVLNDVPKKKKFSKVGESFLIPSTLTLGDFNDNFSANLKSEHYNTIGGYLIETFGCIPDRGESIKRGGFTFRIMKSGPNRIYSIAVRKEES